MTLRVVQISDCHLFAEPHATLKGICPRERFLAVLSALSEELPRADRLVITGDLTHDEKPETYAFIREQLSQWLPVLRMVPGNHDDRSLMRETFPGIIEHTGQRNVFSDSAGNWKLIGLDSQLTGSLRGQLGSTQLTWLADQLRAASSQPAAIFLHHPPAPVGSAWLDQIGLEDAAEFWDLLARFPQVKVICTGHVHQEISLTFGSALVLTTPSTGVQFRPETETLVVDHVSPGFRILELAEDGEVRTRVVRVAPREHPPPPRPTEATES